MRPETKKDLPPSVPVGRNFRKMLPMAWRRRVDHNVVNFLTNVPDAEKIELLRELYAAQELARVLTQRFEVLAHHSKEDIKARGGWRKFAEVSVDHYGVR